MAEKKPLALYGGKIKELQTGDVLGGSAGQKITELTALTSPTSDDIVAVVDDPAGSPVTKKATLANLMKGMPVTTYNATPGNPNGTTSSTGVMMGLAASITPAYSGKVLVVISGDLKSSSSATLRMQIHYGTGSAPANGAALTGTAVGNLATAIGNNAAQQFPATCNAIVAGVTLGTAYWFDVRLSTSAGTGTVQNISICIVEL